MSSNASRISTLESQISTLNTRITGANTQIGALERDLTTVNSAINALTPIIESVNSATKNLGRLDCSNTFKWKGQVQSRVVMLYDNSVNGSEALLGSLNRVMDGLGDRATELVRQISDQQTRRSDWISQRSSRQRELDSLR